MKVVFRTDASLDIGTGHVMRCLTLAEALRGQGANCCFICRDQVGNLCDLIRIRGFDVFPLPMEVTLQEESLQNLAIDENVTPISARLKVDWQTDVKQTKDVILDVSVDWLIVDHYALDVRWESALKPYCQKIMVIDDLADRLHYCDILLDGNVSRKKRDYQGLTPPKCELLIGAEYLLLDPSLDYKSQEKERNGSLFFLGGGDNQEDFKKIIPLLSFLKLPEPITCIFGKSQLNLEALIALCQKYNCHSVISPNNFKELCQTASFAIVRCGLVSYELATFKTPSIAIFKKGIHEDVARWLETKSFTVPITIDSFIDTELVNKAISRALRMRPAQALQEISGTLKAVQHILKVEIL
jgi:UDP-2,4-diacetamido-2,4,6-trideoxy-beta-L-altropyranose hydrolase